MTSVTICRFVVVWDGTNVEVVMEGIFPLLFVLLLSVFHIFVVFLFVGYLILEERGLLPINKDKNNVKGQPEIVPESHQTMEDAARPGGLNPAIRSVEKIYLSLPEDLLLPILSHLDVITLIGMKQVCRNWRQTCNDAIDAKQTSMTKKVFRTNTELREAVKRYCCDDKNPRDMEEIARTYGWPINKWVVSNLKVFSCIFDFAYTFNEDISAWDVSRATTMDKMFNGADDFNQDISTWNVSNVRIMTHMFSGATSFNQDLSNWDVSNVSDMSSMFDGAAAFNQNISIWNVRNVRDITYMFYGATAFNQNISIWNVSNVNNMTSMFYRATAFNQNLSIWNVGNVSSMKEMFFGATSFNQNLSNWNVANVRNMAKMFQEATGFHQNVASWGWDRFLFDENEDDLELLGF